VVEFNESFVGERYARVARVLGDGGTLGDALRALRARVGLPSGLGEAGVPRDKLGRLADLAIEDGCHRENPRSCTRVDLLTLYERSF
jgi:alcohol dehydrogenase class IV